MILGMLGITYRVAMTRNRGGSEENTAKIMRRHVSVAYAVTFLSFSSVSSLVFQTFACETFDKEQTYLRADYSLECTSVKHKAFQAYASLMIFIYPLGIPIAYGAILFNNREELMNEERREKNIHLQPFVDLWEQYKPNRFYFELLDLGRRVLLTGIVVFIYPNTAAQIALKFMIALWFLWLTEILNPYCRPQDT
ncbi:unnamed protein product [Choristocarpus tenellus]